MPNMKRISHILCHLFFLWLLLGASQQGFAFTSKVQAAKSVDVKIGPAEYRSRSSTGRITSHLVNERKTRKAPSGPNPTGNHLPPTKTMKQFSP